jgi:hypothetical protein
MSNENNINIKLTLSNNECANDVSDENKSMTSLIQALKRASSNEHGNRPIQVTASAINDSEKHDLIVMAGDHMIGIDLDLDSSGETNSYVSFTIYNYLHGLDYVEKNNDDYDHFFIV